ncbi:MAG: hypothetical protein IT186_12655 [Acidobacteria bacterium]|nr:hypothetical protein [Acidobacteriota bacterium]
MSEDHIQHGGSVVKPRHPLSGREVTVSTRDSDIFRGTFLAETGGLIVLHGESLLWLFPNPTISTAVGTFAVPLSRITRIKVEGE